MSKVVKCPKCGALYKANGARKFKHCGTMHEINDHLVDFPESVIGCDGNRYCSQGKTQLKYDHHDHCYYCEKTCEKGKFFGCHAGLVLETTRKHDDTYGFPNQDMTVAEGRINAFAPPASMLDILVGRKLSTKMKIFEDQNMDEFAEIYYSKDDQGLIIEYKDDYGNKKRSTTLKELEGHEHYYVLPDGHPNQDDTFIYYRKTAITGYKNGHYFVKVNKRGKILLVDQLCFWNKKDGFYFENPRERVIKDFVFKKGGKYIYFPQGSINPKEGSLFTELSRPYVYLVRETVRNEINHRDVHSYHYLIEENHVEIVMALAQRLTRPTQQKRYPGLSQYQRQELFDKCKPRRTAVKIVDIDNHLNDDVQMMMLNANINMDDITKYNLYKFFQKHPLKYVKSEDELFNLDELYLRKSGIFNSNIFKEYKANVLKDIMETDYGVTKENVHHNTWFDIDDIYHHWNNIRDLFDYDYNIESVLDAIKNQDNIMFYEHIDVINEFLAPFGYEVKKKEHHIFGQDGEIIKEFLTPFNYEIDVDKWIHDEYTKWHEMQDMEDEGLTVYEDDTFTVTELAERKREFQNVVRLNEKGKKKLQRDMKACKLDIDYQGGHMGRVPIPEIIIKDGMLAFEELAQEFTNEDGEYSFEQIMKSLATSNGNFNIFNHNPAIMTETYEMKPDINSWAIIGASQLITSILEETHRERKNDKVKTIIDHSPLLEAIIGNLLRKKNLPQVVITGMGPGVDTAVAFAVLLINMLVEDVHIDLVLAFPGNIFEYFLDLAKYNKKAAEAFFGLCLSQEVTMMSFVEEDHQEDLLDPNYHSPKYNLRNDWMAKNARLVLDFLSKGVGGTAYTCERKKEYARQAKVLMKQAKHAERTGKRRYKYGDNEYKGWFALSKQKSNEAKMYDGKVDNVFTKDHLVYEYDPLDSTIFTNRPVKIKKGTKEKLVFKFNDSDLCYKRMRLIKLLNKDKHGLFPEQVPLFTNKSNKDLLFSIRVILGRDFQYVDKEIQGYFNIILKDFEYMESFINNDRTYEYYEFLGYHIDDFYDERLGMSYGYGVTGGGWKNRYCLEVLKDNHQIVPRDLMDVMKDTAYEFRTQTADRLRRTSQSNTSSKKEVKYKCIWGDVLASDLPKEEIERIKNSPYESWKLHYHPTGTVGVNYKRGPLYVRTIVDKIPIQINNETKRTIKQARTFIEEIKYEIYIWKDLLAYEARGVQASLARQALRSGGNNSDEDENMQPAKWFKEGSIEKKIAFLEQHLKAAESNA